MTGRPGAEAFALAERVIQASSREQPADRVLRQELKSHAGIPPGTATQVSRAVFAYFRWLGWLEQRRQIRQQIEQALALAERFAAQPGSFPDAELLARAIPAWTGLEVKTAATWVRTLQSEPKVWLRARKGQGRELARRLGDCRVFGTGALSDILEYSGEKDLFLLPEFHQGAFELQDLSSQAVGLVCGARAGETWWDACAGEGGKTLHLSDLMGNKGLIWVSDRAEWRLKRLKRRAGRAGVFNYRMAVWDGGERLPTKTRFDGVLVDAPCSGIGTWQRNPHARWTTGPEDVRELGRLQRQLLVHAAQAVKPGGKIIYAVCTLARQETNAVAEAFGRDAADFEPLPLSDPLATSHTPSLQLCLHPQEHGGNGMFIAAWRRRP